MYQLWPIKIENEMKKNQFKKNESFEGEYVRGCVACLCVCDFLIWKITTT